VVLSKEHFKYCITASIIKVGTIYSVEVKSGKTIGITEGDCILPDYTDTEARKHGSRLGLDTRLVHALNDECSLG